MGPAVTIEKEKFANGEPDLKNFVITVTPGDDSPWFGGKYRFKVNCPPQYPTAVFNVEIMDPVYHPNMDLVINGKPAKICLSLLRTEWRPAYGVKHLTYSLAGMFVAPNHADPLNREAATLMRNDLAAFHKKVKETLKGGKFDFEEDKGVWFPKFS